MSFFGVTVETMERVWTHPQADRLELASLIDLGFQFVVAKGAWKAGDRCLYFPVDSIIPQKLLVALGLEGRLAGSQKNRVKTIKLRGEISQGVVGALSLIEDLPTEEWTPERITEFLGVTKYEPEIEASISMAGELIDLPQGVGVYDIEGVERFPSSYERLLSMPVWISEKIEGSHFSCTADTQTWVNQRRFSILPKGDTEHLFWTVARERGIIELVEAIKRDTKAQQITLRGEIIGPGIQSNIYRLREHRVLFFDIARDRRYLDVGEFLDTMEKYGRSSDVVPTISLGVPLHTWLSGETIDAAANGKSLLHTTEREGIVIRPMSEMGDPELNGRLILKKRSPEYLAKHDF